MAAKGYIWKEAQYTGCEYPPGTKKEQNRLEKRSKISLTKGGRSDNIAKLSAGAGQKSGIDTET